MTEGKNEIRSLPQSGYALEKVYTNEMHLSVVPPGENETEDEGVSFGWDWEIVDATTFEVRIKLSNEPSPARHERIQLVISARFRVVGSPPSVDFSEFVKTHAVAILMPYARETLSALTLRGYYSPILLPALHVINLVKNLDPAETTGAKQLASGMTAPFAVRLGESLPSSRSSRPKSASIVRASNTAKRK